jgi:hypothetical protein
MPSVALRSPPSPTGQPGEPFHWSIDESLRRIFVTISGSPTGKLVSKGICSIFLTRPDAVTYDMLYDMRTYAADVTADDVLPLVAVYEQCNPDRSVACRTAFVTPDPNFILWAKAFDEQFPGRAHACFKDFATAEVYLDHPLHARTPR